MYAFISLPIVLLTKTGNFITRPLSEVLSAIMNVIFNFVYSFTETASLGISIIFFTIIVRLIMLPLMINQQKSMRKFQKVQPQLQKIQNKYKNKKDPESQQKMQKELAAFYKEHKVSPLGGGCLPLLVQMPIFFALFNVLRNIPAYITKVGVVFSNIASEIMNVENYATILNDNFSSIIRMIKNYNPEQQNYIIDVLSKLNPAQWDLLLDKLPVNVTNSIEMFVEQQANMNNFLGFNLADKPGWAFPGIIFPILAGLTTYFQSKLMSAKTNNTKSTTKSTNDTASQTQNTMTIIFPFITAFFTATMPLGLGIYWVVSNLFSIVQQFFINLAFDKDENHKGDK